MRKIKDTRFLLTPFFEEKTQNDHTYKYFENEIKDKGFIVINTETDTVNVYNPTLAFFLRQERLTVQSMDSGVETKISGWEYLKTYIEGYNKGAKDFDSEFSISPEVLYGANAEQYVKDLHLNYFHIKHNKKHEGWHFVREKFNEILTHNQIKEYGYYSGIVAKVGGMVKKYPQLFRSFNECEFESPPQPIKTSQTPPENIVIKPTIATETAEDLFDIMKGSFETGQHAELKNILKTGTDAKQWLVFKGNANRLTDSFKQLIEKNLLTGCNKEHLQKWLITNFQYLNKGEVNNLNPGTTHKSISGKSYPCKNPLIKIQKGQVLRADK